MDYQRQVVRVYGVAQGPLPDGLVAKLLPLRSLNMRQGDDAIGLVMSYESAGTLFSLLHPRNEGVRHTLDLYGKVHLSRELVNAVACLHGCGIVHGDIKPENIMLSSLGQSVSICVSVCL